MKNNISRRHWLAGTSALGIGTLLPQNSLATTWSNGSENNEIGYRYQISTTGDIFSGGEDGEEEQKADFKVETHLTYKEKVITLDGNRFGLRQYQQAETEMRFGAQQARKVSLGDSCREILVLPFESESSQIEFRCTSDQFTGAQQDLLRTPFNTFFYDQMANSLFGEKTSLEEGHSVKLSNRIAAGLFGIGQVESNDLTLTVQKANSSQAIIKLSGKIVGKYLDANTTITATGSLRAIFSNQSISQVRATFEEKREKGVIGPKFHGKTKLKLDPQKDLPALKEDFQKRLLSAAEGLPTLQFRSRQNPLVVRHDADWKVVYDQPGAIIWRRVLDGEPVGQCSLVIPATKAVRKLTLEKYADGVLESLKDSRPKLVSKKTIKKDDHAEIHHVVVEGMDDGMPVHWNHCLISYKDGRRAEVVMTNENAFQDLLKGKELEIAKSLNLLAQKMADLSEKKIR